MSEQSLAATAGVLSTPGFQVPDIFQEPQEKVVGAFSTPYIVFAHKNRQDQYAKLVGQFGLVNEGDMFLIEPTGITKLETAKLGLMKLKQYWVETDASGQILRSSFVEMPFPWKEQMDVVVIVYLADRIVIANINPHTTKCPGFKVLADALDECQKPTWGDKSPAHRETLQIANPMMRFFGEMTLGPQRTSKKSGLPYRVTQCVIKPTTNVEANLLRAWVADDSTSEKMKDAADRFLLRMRDLESKLVK